MAFGLNPREFIHVGRWSGTLRYDPENRCFTFRAFRVNEHWIAADGSGFDWEDVLDNTFSRCMKPMYDKMQRKL